MRTHRPKPDLEVAPGTALVPGDDPRSQPAGLVFASALGGYLLDLRAQEPGVLDGVDPEALHDYRVALRRARSVLWGGHRTFPAEELELLEALTVWLARLTSTARDLDVLVGDLPGLFDALPSSTLRGRSRLQRQLVEQRDAAYATLHVAMRSARYGVLLRRWDTMASLHVDGGIGVASGLGRDARRPSGVVAERLLSASLQRARKSGRVALQSDDRSDWHRLRKDVKRFRYLLTGCAPIFPIGAVDAVESELRDLQDVLGRLQDRHVQALLVEHAGVAVNQLEAPRLIPVDAGVPLRG
ncbi:MAG: CHAD domain-containing protein, partial [Actinomycetes bacterium]